MSWNKCLFFISIKIIFNIFNGLLNFNKINHNIKTNIFPNINQNKAFISSYAASKFADTKASSLSRTSN